MKRIPLTQGKYTIVDDQDFEWLNQFKWYYAKGYAVRGGRPQISMARSILNYKGSLLVDHRNGDAIDNRRSNIRVATRQWNRHNSKRPTTNTSGYKGVSWRKPRERWIAYLNCNGKRIHLGSFPGLKDAALAYNEGAKKYFGQYARLNNV